MRRDRDLEQQHVERRAQGLHGAQAEIVGERELPVSAKPKTLATMERAASGIA